MMVMMMEPPSFCLAKDKYMCPPQKKKHTRMFLVICWGEKTIVFMHNLVPLLEEQEKCLEGF